MEETVRITSIACALAASVLAGCMAGVPPSTPESAVSRTGCSSPLVTPGAERPDLSNTLGMPLLVAEADGRLREPFDRIGGVRVGPPISRRRRRSALRQRRPARPLRRRTGTLPATPLVHRGGREIIARN